MKWFWRIFRAPGDDEIDLPIEKSSWHVGRYVKILDGHWDTIIQFASEIDPIKSEKLDMLAQSRDDADGETDISNIDLQEMLIFMDLISSALEDMKDVSIAPSEDDPDGFENSVYIDMIKAVRSVIEETLRLGQPFDAWLEYD